MAAVSLSLEPREEDRMEALERVTQKLIQADMSKRPESEKPMILAGLLVDAEMRLMRAERLRDRVVAYIAENGNLG